MQIRDSVRSFLRQNFYVEGELPGDASLLGHGVVDSTGILEVIAFIEETFEITVEDLEMVPENLDSVDAIAAFVCRKQGATEAEASGADP